MPTTITGYTKTAVDARNVGVFHVESYGAVGDGTTNDTAAIQAAIDAAATWAASHNGYGEVRFQAKTYLVNSAASTTRNGNAILTLPLVAATAVKTTLVLRGAGDATALPHWGQTTPQRSSTVLRTTRTDGTNGANGPACVIGGPNQAGGYGGTYNGLFSNMMAVVDGISIVVPADSTFGGFDFFGLAEAVMENGSVFTDQTPGSLGGAPNLVHDWTAGVWMPSTGNNDNCHVGNFSCEGLTWGAMLTEHTVVHNMRAIYCVVGIGVGYLSGTDSGHAVSVLQGSIEACTHAVGFYSHNMRIDAMIDVEAVTDLVYDPGNNAFGELRYCYDDQKNNPYSLPTRGSTASNLSVLAVGVPRGAATAPTVPASTTALINPFDRPAAVTVTGGTVTAIAVAGTSLGVTAGTVMVPAGKTITLTYSAAPSWKWTIL